MAADESTTPLCGALVVAGVPAAVLVDVEMPLDRVNDSSPAVTVTVCMGGWALMKAVAVTVGLVDPVSELGKRMYQSAKYILPTISRNSYRLIVTVVARVGLVEVVEIVKVGVLVGVGIICMGVAVARTGVGVRKVVVNRPNCSSPSSSESLRSSRGGGPFRRLDGFIVFDGSGLPG